MSRVTPIRKVKPENDGMMTPERLAEAIARLEEGVAVVEKHLADLSEKVSKAAEGDYSAKALQQMSALLRKVVSVAHAIDPRQFLQAEEVDEFGRDPAFEDKIEPLFTFLYEKFWRVEVRGIENVPAKGGVLLVANHSGSLPYDGAMIKYAMRKDHPAARDVRLLVEDFVYYFPFLGTIMYRIGGVRACPENAQRLLSQGEPVICFPEGVKGLGKLYSERYRLQRFGRGGFIRLCMKTGVPIVPIAVVGAEEIHPMIYRISSFARMLGIPYLPVTPTFPWLGPVGLIPLPTKWTIEFGKPIAFDQYTPAQIDNPILVNRLAEEVRQNIQSMIAGMLTTRTSIWS